MGNYAYIDEQNLYLGLKKLGWMLDYRKFRVYLKDKYKVTKAYVFIGYVEKNKKLYQRLIDAGFELYFRKVVVGKNGKQKSNIDTDLVLQIMKDIFQFQKAVIVTSDGDFYSIVDCLVKINKLEAVLSPEFKDCSSLLLEYSKNRIQFISDLKIKLQYLPS